MPDDVSDLETRIAIVGAGFRATSFLTSDADLLGDDLTVVEQSDVVASTSFREYDATTTSIGSRFFQHVDYRGAMEELRRNADYLRVAESAHAVDMRELATALDALGSAMRAELGSGLITRTRIRSADAGPDGVTLTSDDGRMIRAQHLVLATGRREVLIDDLNEHRHKVELSGDFIRRSNDVRGRIQSGDFTSGPVVILGSSHSAMSVLHRLVRAGSAGHDVEVVVLQRSPARLMYPTLTEAREQYVDGRELRADPALHVCRSSGIVFRDSGLRGVSGELYRRLWQGEVRGARLVRAASPEIVRSTLKSASTIIQAVGYRPEHPQISVDGTVRLTATAGRLTAEQDATALIDGRAVPRISLLRVGQTPAELRDHAAYGATLYRDLRDKLVAR
jgi:hypothetical protein